MLLPTFDYHGPVTIEQACELKRDLGSESRLLAGGTDLLVHLKKKLVSPDHLIDLGKIEALKEIAESQGRIAIGSNVTVSELVESKLIKEKLTALNQGAGVLGSALVRNRATIGGNINSARPAGDLLPSLMGYRAILVLETAAGKREILLEDFIKGPGQTDIKPDEIMTRILVPLPPKNSGAAYLQLGKRKSQEINIVNVASNLVLHEDDTIKNATIVLGSVGPTPLRALSAEKVLQGKAAGEALFTAAGEAARNHDCRPIDDFRGSADYRRAMVGILTKRTLSMAHKDAGRA